MNARLFRIIYTDEEVAPERRLRLWLGCGQPLMLLGVLVQLCWDRYDETYQAHWMVRQDDSEDESGGAAEVMPFAPLSLDALPDYRLVPRATSEDLTGRMTGVLLELQYLGGGRAVWEAQPCTRRNIA